MFRNFSGLYRIRPSHLCPSPPPYLFDLWGMSCVGGVDGFWIGQRSHGGRVPEPGEADPQKTQPAIGGQVQHRIAALCVSVSTVPSIFVSSQGCFLWQSFI